MKICDLALFSPETSSGVRTYIANKLRYTSARSDVLDHIVVVPGAEDAITMHGRSKVISVRGLPSFYPGISIAVNFGKIADIIEKEAPDLIEVNCQYTLAWAAFLATRHRRIPIVGVYHTDVPACAAHMAKEAGLPMPSLMERIVELYEGLIYRHFTLTIVLNSGVIRRLNRLGVHRTEQLPCGVDIGTFNPEQFDSTFRKRLGLLPKQKVLLYVGRLSAEKEIDLLLQAYQELPVDQFILLIVGEGPETDSIKRYAASHPGVMVLGHFDRPAELASIYASSDVFVIPSRYETFGMAALEAMACGLPVVAIADSGTAALVSTDVGLLSRAGDPADLAGKIRMVAAWSRDRTRDLCRSFASKSYSWDVVFDRYFDIYRQLIRASNMDN